MLLQSELLSLSKKELKTAGSKLIFIIILIIKGTWFLQFLNLCKLNYIIK
jgi:hypothetical protein